MDRITAKYQLPRAVLARMLRAPGALEYEIAIWLSERAAIVAERRFAAQESAPEGDDVFSRAVRGIYAQIERKQAAAEQAERMRRYAETDAYLARVKAGEIELGEEP